MASKKYDLIAGGTSQVTGTATFDEAARSISMAGTLPIASAGGAADLSAIAEDVLPATDDTYDLGSASKRWVDVHASGIFRASLGDTRMEMDANHVVGYTPDADSGTSAQGKTFGAQPAWWDGAASVMADIGISLRARAAAPHSRMELFVSDDQDDYATVYLDSAYGFYPDTNNVGSLGIAGKAWGDLFVAVPTSDPAVAGQAWEFTGDITALTNYLAGGGRLMALGNPA